MTLPKYRGSSVSAPDTRTGFGLDMASFLTSSSPMNLVDLLPMTTRAKTPMSLMDIHLAIHRVHYASPVDLELKDHFKWCRPPKNDQSDCQPDIYIYILSKISKIGYYSSWWICRWMDIYYQKCIVLSLSSIYKSQSRWYRSIQLIIPRQNGLLGDRWW